MEFNHQNVSKIVSVIIAACFVMTSYVGAANALQNNVGAASTVEDVGQGVFFYQQSEYPRDCHEVISGCTSSNSSGVFVIKPDGYPEPFDVYCSNEAMSSGWTVIFRRAESLVGFGRGWEDYKHGFGFLSSDYWIGNEKLSFLTNQAVYDLHIDMELSNGSSLLITYSGFRIGDEWDNYKLLSIEKFSADGDDALTSCPRNMGHGNCTCQQTCDEPTRCSGDCDQGAEGCYCPTGFLLDGNDCVAPSDCPCFWPEVNTIISNGQSFVNDDCTEGRNCTGRRLIREELYQCDLNARCKVKHDVRGCYCDVGFEGDGQTCEAISKDCYDVYIAGNTQDGIYTVHPNGWNGPSFNVSCVMDNGGGWTVFQRRGGIDRGTSFYQNWTSYREGFGLFSGDFWLGNEKLHYLTRQRDYKLRVDIQTSGGTPKYAEYTSFATAGENDEYRLSISGYSGNAVDGMTSADGAAFSTYDSDNDGCDIHNCAAEHRGAWWYGSHWCSHDGYSYCDRFNYGSTTKRCTDSSLNGVYNGGNGVNIFWYQGRNCDLNSAEMKIRPAL